VVNDACRGSAEGRIKNEELRPLRVVGKVIVAWSGTYGGNISQRRFLGFIPQNQKPNDPARKGQSTHQLLRACTTLTYGRNISHRRFSGFIPRNQKPNDPARKGQSTPLSCLGHAQHGLLGWALGWFSYQLRPNGRHKRKSRAAPPFSPTNQRCFLTANAAYT
jgi:hypothetical protein